VLVGGAPGDPATRLFVVEQYGAIQILESGAALSEPFLDVSDLVSTIGEQGLLGLAFHPGYAQNGRFFVNYTNHDGDTVVAEYKRSSDPNKADPTPVKTLLTIDQPYPNHNGGNVVFGPDGFLYIGMGDGGLADDPNGNGQDPDSKLGKMLRIDVDNYPAAPPGNVPGGDPDVWDLGMRNPWRWSFDACTGDLYIGDVGQDAWEEIDVEPAGEGNKNYGWDVMEGTHCHEPSSGCDQTGLTMPVIEYPHGADCSVTGGFVYRGAAIPNLVGTYFYGDYCTGNIWTFKWKDGAISEQADLTSDLESAGTTISSFGQDTAGELYVCDHEGGHVYRIDAE
jgi:glucose/arabinose dehydrogenase